MGSTTLDPSHARRWVLNCQGLHRQAELGSGKPAALRALTRLGYVQIDTISVVERAHHHTLWTRANNYHNKHLDQLQQDRTIFEYWSHAAAYLPMADYRFSLPRKNAIAGGQKHWFEKDEKLAKEVLDRVRQSGPVQSKDFEHTRKPGTAGWWEWKPAKRTLEQLFMEGELMVARRQGFQKVYDLTERVVPSAINTTVPTEQEYLDHLIFRYLHSNGLGTAAQIGYLRKGIKAKIRTRCDELIENGDLINVSVGGQHYLAVSEDEQREKPLSRTRVAILSPFDNLLIQRERTQQLFDFNYQIECYVPAKKRKFGYFVLPILWGQRFAGRMDAKINRKRGLFEVLHLSIETDQIDDFCRALSPALAQFLTFNGGNQINVHDIKVNGRNLSSFETRKLNQILVGEQ